MRFPLLVKLMAVIALVILLPSAAFLAHVYSSSRDEAIGLELQRMRNYSREIATEIDSYLVSQQNLTRFATISNELRDYLRRSDGQREAAGFSQWLSNWKGISDDIAEVFVMNGSGTCVAASNPEFVGKSYAFRPYFKAAISGEDFVSDWVVGVTSKKAGIYLSSPIRLGERVGGVLAIKLDPAPIDRIIQRSFGLGMQAFVTNGAGVVLAHYDQSIRYTTVDDLTTGERSAIRESQQFAGIEQRSLKLASLRADMARVRPGETLTSAVYGFRGEKKIAAMTGAHFHQWVAGIAAPLSAIEAPANRLLHSILPLAVVILLFTAISAWYVSRYLASPLQHLLAAVTRFGAGDSSARAAIEHDDEVGSLAIAFNDMAERISKQTSELEQRVAERTTELQDAYERLKRVAVTDPLTGCFNRRYLDEHLAEELARAQRYDSELSVLMCDIDFFKRVNDSHGHQAGDRVLIEIAAVLRTGSRQQIDWVARYGGEEFLLVLPESSREDALQLAERLRRAIETRALSHEGTALSVTASFGLSTCRHVAEETSDTLLARADEALYKAKEAGRNRVVAG